MNKSLFIRSLSVVVATIVFVFMSACSKQKVDMPVPSEPTPSDTQSTELELLPIEATFDEKYIKLVSKKGNELNLKGNVGANVSAKSTEQYDPNTFESLVLKETYEFSNGLGVGDLCAKFMEHFAVTQGYYVAYDSNGKPVDIEVKSKNGFTFAAILKFDEKTNKITYVAGGNVGQHIEGLAASGADYLKSANIGVDILVVKLYVKGDLTVKSFDIAHYIL